MLYDILDSDEVIHALVSGTYRVGQHTRGYRGVAVATNRRLIFLGEGQFSGKKNVSDMPYHITEGITHSTGIFSGGVQITGAGTWGWRIDNVDPPDSAKSFADSVQSQIETLRAEAPQLSSADAGEMGKWAKRLEWQNEVDAQWDAVMPRWPKGKTLHLGEQIMLYDILDSDEVICALIHCNYRAEQDTIPLRLHTGVAVATNRRVILLDEGIFGNEDVSEIPYHSIEEITHSYGMFFCGVQITGPGTWEWRLEIVGPKASAWVFADNVRSQVEALRAEDPQPLSIPTSTGANDVERSPHRSTDVDVLEEWAKHFERQHEIDAQWYAVMPNWSGGKKMHSGERQMLYDILDYDEDILALVGGMYRAEQDTARVGKHNGVAVATNKRVIFLDKGVFGSKEVSEMPYRSVEGITHSTGMFYGGVQITGLGTSGWRIEDVNPKDSAKSFADSVRFQVEAPRAEAPQPSAMPTTSAADELAKWAKLYQDGILTQAEFDAKKKQLLGL